MFDTGGMALCAGLPDAGQAPWADRGRHPCRAGKAPRRQNAEISRSEAESAPVYGTRYFSAPAYLQYELTRFKLDFVEPCGKIRALGVCPDFTEAQTRAWYDANRDLFTRYFGDSFSYEESRQIIEKRMREEVYEALVQDILCEPADRQGRE